MIKLPSFIRNRVNKRDEDFSFGVSPIKESDIRKDATLTFKIFPANGGYIVEFYKYDRNNDRCDNTLYVIHSSDDMTSEIASICQREFLQL
jgi:hypothetical protein